MRISDWSSDVCSSDLYNGATSFEIDGQAAPGYSSGTALKAMEELAKENLPAGVGYSWTNLSYEEAASAGQASALYTLSVLIVFLCLAALYESWAIPFAVLLVVPLGAIGALLAATMTGLANDVRSEEHTSELQSLMRISYAVFCLKKKTTTQRRHTCTN